MAIIGLTHNADGQVKLRRAVTTKVAIGLAPRDGQNYPSKLDHFVVLKKAQRGSGKDAKMEWELDQEKMGKYGKSPTELWIVLLDDDPDVAFRTEYAWWAKTGRFCHGDGVNAQRLDTKGEFKPWKPCAEGGCQDINDPKKCKPSGDLYFMLADYPALGSICRLHTSSYQSIMEIRSALEDLRGVTGGRLLGLRVKLFVRPEKNVYDGPQGKVTGTKFILGLELAAEDLPKLAASMVETAQLFQGIRHQLAGRTIEYDDDQDDIAAEFNPDAEEPLVQIMPPEKKPPAVDPAVEQRALVTKLMDQLNYNQAKKSAMLAQYGSDLPKLIEGLQKRLEAEKSLGIDDQDKPGPDIQPGTAVTTPLHDIPAGDVKVYGTGRGNGESAVKQVSKELEKVYPADPGKKQGGFSF